MLLPPGSSSMIDAPADLLRAIYHANKILDWYENFPEDDIPPEWMWPFEEELDKWFKELKAEKAAGSETSDDRTKVPLMDNELTAGKR